MSQVATEAILTNSCKQCRQRSALSAVSTMSALLPLWWINTIVATILTDKPLSSTILLYVANTSLSQTLHGPAWFPCDRDNSAYYMCNPLAWPRRHYRQNTERGNVFSQQTAVLLWYSWRHCWRVQRSSPLLSTLLWIDWYALVFTADHQLHLWNVKQKPSFNTVNCTHL